ncbi:MAG: biopolymer transporter ExbD [Thermosynechococcaceae cyanobacterium MS004]|nr:biopolymer transporter ExbD [Thermosynechococcaceae cyanobacterium MS004]
MKTYLEPDDLDVRIEIVPLIDVIFCILVFFILGAVSFGRLQGLNVDLPTAATAQTQLSDTLTVEVDALGQIKIENTPVLEEQLVRILAAYVRQKPQGVVVLQADKLVSYGQIARLVDTLQKVGGNRVALGAIKEDSTGSDPQAPGTFQPDLTQPNLTQPGSTQPDLTQPGVVQPNLTQPNLTQPNLAQPDPTQPNQIQPDSTQPNLTQPNLPQPTPQPSP